jgi:hypothetical protein
MNWKRIVFLVAFMSVLVSESVGQTTIINKSSKKFTHLIIYDYDSEINTKGFCDFVLEVNQLTTSLKSDSSTSIDFKFESTKRYNIFAFDTTNYPHYYSGIAFKYYVSGDSKSIVLTNQNVEKDFFGHCTEGMAEHGYEDLELDIENESGKNLLKVYYSYNDSLAFKRYSYLHQWKSIKDKTRKTINIYNSRPKASNIIYIKYYLELKGEITQLVQSYPLTEDQIKLTVKFE